MITAIIGHRGTGKTELLKRLGAYFRDQEVELLDLDEEIEKKIGKKIYELVMESGEAYFRELERQVFLESLQIPHKDMYLVMGAGFDTTVIPESVRILWVRRKTDLDGRIFLDRPRLNPDMSPMEEFKKRAVTREQSYALAADQVYEMPEGVFLHHHRAMAIEKSILTHDFKDLGGVVTLMPTLFDKESRWQFFKQRFLGAGVDYFELRDDLLTPDLMRRVIEEMHGERFVLSLRQSYQEWELWRSEERADILTRVHLVDWALELGAADEALVAIPAEKWIVSSHGLSGDSLLSAYADKGVLLKWAPEVTDIRALEAGHRWQMMDTKKRSFLPRSSEGRWYWYRAWQKNRQPLNFWRYDEGSAADQPSLFVWLWQPEKANQFAAVVGYPVFHSYTPLEHSEFFAKRQIPIYAINLQRDEWKEGISFLQSLGLQYVAVTSPLKESAGQMLPGYQGTGANTLYWSSSKKAWLGTSTDLAGFTELIEGVGMIAPLQAEIFIWGGGGVLDVLKKTLPHASYFASRTGLPREGSEEAMKMNPKILIWAAPRHPETSWPPLDWSPAMVFDLNYKEDSMGREYSLRCGAHYQSGSVMFESQARGQRQFWTSCEEGE